MGEKNDLYAHVAFGDTNRADSVPDCPEPGEGPVYLEGRLVLSLSFQGGPADVHTEDAGELVERYRLWDDFAEAWYGGLEVLRFEWTDAVVCLSPKPAVLWQGSVDTRARVVPVHDLNSAGMAANQKCDLRWKRV
ncbi:MAG: hypothetical protein IJ111_03870 [Eggerthellaceae bacterium]|nr:hypothetical protein [Eggerthellaceae bacterium]